MASPTQTLVLEFPLRGMDVTTEFQLQPDGTTPLGLNVRSFEPGSKRNRGGARSGLSKYLNSQVAGVPGLIQHLNIIVDPTIEATQAQLEDFEFNPDGDHADDGILDPSNNPDPANPRNPGRYIRRKGSGRSQRRGVRTKFLAQAENDSLSTSAGSPATDVDVLANDTYDGTPRITIVSPPSYGTASVVGTGSSSRIRYTPPADGTEDVQDVIRYRLRASGNAPGNANVLYGPNYAVLTVDVTVSQVEFVQRRIPPAHVGNLTTGVPYNFGLPANPESGNLLVVAVATMLNSGATPGASYDLALTVTNAAAAPYTQIGSFVEYNEFDPPPVRPYQKLSLWYRFATGTLADERNVIVTPTWSEPFTSIELMAVVAEYRNAGPPEANSSASVGGSSFPSSWTTGSVAVSGPRRMLLGVYMTNLEFSSGAFGFTSATERFEFSSVTETLGLWLGDFLNVSSSAPVLASYFGGQRYAGIGASFPPV